MKMKHKFGVEIEVALGSAEAREAVRRVVAAGVPCNLFQNAEHRRSNTWKCVTDGSCGYEFVSPPLRDLASVKIVCDTLCAYEKELQVASPTRIFASVQTGLHVHHDARDFTADMARCVITSYYNAEEEVDKAMPRGRRGNNNNYCQSIRTARMAPGAFLGFTGMRDVASAAPGRYWKLNLAAWLRHGTLEFRQHSGTISYAKIENWIIVTAGIMERARAAEQFLGGTLAKFVAWATPAAIKGWTQKDDAYVAWVSGQPMSCAPASARTYASWFKNGYRLPAASETVRYFVKRAERFGFSATGGAVTASA